MVLRALCGKRPMKEEFELQDTSRRYTSVVPSIAQQPLCGEWSYCSFRAIGLYCSADTIQDTSYVRLPVRMWAGQALLVYGNHPTKSSESPCLPADGS